MGILRFFLQQVDDRDKLRAIVLEMATDLISQPGDRAARRGFDRKRMYQRGNPRDLMYDAAGLLPGNGIRDAHPVFRLPVPALQEGPADA